MNTPKDPPLFLTVFVAVCILVILGVWFLMPVYRLEPEDYEGILHEPLVGVNLVLSPEKLLRKVKEAIQRGEAALIQLETEEKEGEETEAFEEKKAEEK